MNRLTAFTLAAVLLTPVTALHAASKPAAEVADEQVRHDIAVLAERRVISASDYWLEHVVTGGKCDGAKVAMLLVEVAKIFKPVTTTEEAIAEIARRGIIGQPEYWAKNAVAGGVCAATSVATVLNHIVGRLPVPPPKSAKATPLEPTPAAQLKDSYDIIIAGGGTGGVGAAVQAARMGRSVLLLEETDWVGGQMNAAAVTSMDEGRTLCRERGLYRELCALIMAHYQPLGINCETAYWLRHVCVEPRVGQRLLLTMLGDARGAGVLDLSLRSRVTKVLKNRNAVTGAEVEIVTAKGKETRSIGSRVLIDATEWGDVIPLTGARYRVGNCTNDSIKPAQQVQANTWTAVVKQYPQGVPAELLMTQPPPGYTEKVHTAFVRSLGDGAKIDTKAKPWTWATFIGYRAMPDSSRPGDSPPITRTHLNYNNDFPSTVAEIEDLARRRATDRDMRLKTLHLLYYIQTALGKKDWAVANDEGYHSPYNRAEIDAWLKERPDLAPYRSILYHFSVMPYTRESRRIVGLHTLVAREIERHPGKPTRFPHTVALGDYAVDLHGSMTPKYLEAGLDRPEDIPTEKFGSRGVGPFPIPFECFIPEKVDGFLPAEKNISQSRMANGATRLQPHTMLMGQAAGAIAALAVQRNVHPRDLDPVLVQLALLDADDILFLTPITDIRRDGPNWKSVQLVLTHGLLTDEKGKFNPRGKLTAADLATIVAKLFPSVPPLPATDDAPVTGARFLQVLTSGIAASDRPFELKATLKDPAQPITRAEAAQVLAKLLEQRAAAPRCAKRAALSPAERFNYVIGTQTFSPSYQFTGKTRLVETAEVIREMGANVIKFELARRYASPNSNVPAADPSIQSLADLAQREPSHRHVLDMPFAYYVLWAHTFNGGEGKWRRGFSKEDAAKEYREIHDLTAHLLKTYSGTGRTFFLGHWEGDGFLRGTVKKSDDAKVTPEAAQGMADWLTTRQRAVDDARRDTPHHDVQVWHYTEVNHVKLAMNEDRPALVNRVLPQAPVDYVSYSSYDTASDPALLKRALDYIESKLTPKPGIAGKRVFIGEYGFPAVRHTPQEQDRLSRTVMRAGLEWGCPFVLYWELYNNEVAPDGQQRGFWLIDDKGVKQPVYETHRRFLDWARTFVAGRQSRGGKIPTGTKFREAAVREIR
ncbi:MAG: FAD-dependent oxidoreductase [Verrucomicrobia bacterium]|nr:FAD-dependent oxidoreductase [Verrucomicrobiota bacterium]